MESGRRRFLTLLGAAGLSACAPRPLAGRDVELTPLRSYSALEGRILVGLADVRGVTVRNGVDCYRVTYPTHDGRGRPVRATGLMALPQGDAPRGLVSFQHGTTTTRSAPLQTAPATAWPQRWRSAGPATPWSLRTTLGWEDRGASIPTSWPTSPPAPSST